MDKKESTTENILLLPLHVRTYNFIKNYKKQNLYSPEIKEIARGLKRSERQIYRILDDLQALGYITRRKYADRSIELVNELA